MKQEYNLNQRKLYTFANGITLISLVITIILLIILAGIGINLSIGENGLFNKAKYAKEKYLNAQAFEEEQLNELYEELGLLGDLPENTPETNAGTIVKMPSRWETTTPYYVSTQTGKEVISSKKVASVYAVSTGDGKSIPVPIGFYYVGGKLNSGVVISDEKVDKNKYAGQEDVPSGITLNEDNTINYELKGNQFVWIPCEEENYIKYDWGTEYRNIVYDTNTSGGEYIQIQKYGGFYVGRYETGLASTIEEATSTMYKENSNYNSFGIPQSKAGLVPWNFIDYENIQKNAKSMYKTDYVSSGLITGTMWDSMITYIADGNRSADIITTLNSWGNYADTTPKINIGRKAYSFVSGSAWAQNVFGNIEYSTKENTVTKPLGEVNIHENGKAYLLTTGASEDCKMKNLYDVIGNLREWTEEVSLYEKGRQFYVNRTGTCGDNSKLRPACYRSSNELKGKYFENGFRVALYIK